MIHEGPPARKRWPLAIIAAGWIVLAESTVTIEEPNLFLLGTMPWRFAAWLAALLTVLLLITGKANVRKAAAAVTIVFGVGRSVAYMQADVWPPVGVWAIIIGLVITSYRSAVRADPLVSG